MTDMSIITEDLGQHFTNLGSKIFNDDLYASHYLYTDAEILISSLH